LEGKEEEAERRIMLVWYVVSRFMRMWGGGMALAYKCVHGGFCFNSAECVDITTGELSQFITGSVIAHSLHGVHEGNAFSGVHVCLSVHSSVHPSIHVIL
jgi:hypothetical protein